MYFCTSGSVISFVADILGSIIINLHYMKGDTVMEIIKPFGLPSQMRFLDIYAHTLYSIGWLLFASKILKCY